MPSDDGYTPVNITGTILLSIGKLSNTLNQNQKGFMILSTKRTDGINSLGGKHYDWKT